MIEMSESHRRMTSTDAVMWAIEKDPLLRTTMTGVLMLDQPAKPDVVLEVMERASRLVPRLRERVMSDPWSVAPPRWETDPFFDLSYHVRFGRVPEGGVVHDVLDVAQLLAMQCFDRARPLWEMVVLDGLADGRGAVVLKLHHSITDAVGFINMAMAFFDLERDGWSERGLMPDVPGHPVPSLPQRFADGLAHEVRHAAGLGGRVGRSVLSTAVAATRDRSDAWRRVTEGAASVVRTMAPATQPLSPIMGDRSLARRFYVVDVPLADLKGAGNAVGGRMNDAFVAAVLGGLARYHDDRGAPCDALRVHMPVSVRAADSAEGGNFFAPARFTAPLSGGAPAARIREMTTLLGAVRAEPALPLLAPVSGVLYRLGTTVSAAAFLAMMRGVDVVTSNVPGVPVTAYFAGTKIEGTYPFGPLAGAAVNVSLMSYVDRVGVGISIDAAAVPDPDVLVQHLRDAFDEVLAVAAPPTKRPAKRPVAETEATS